VKLSYGWDEEEWGKSRALSYRLASNIFTFLLPSNSPFPSFFSRKPAASAVNFPNLYQSLFPPQTILHVRLTFFSVLFSYFADVNRKERCSSAGIRRELSFSFSTPQLTSSFSHKIYIYIIFSSTIRLQILCYFKGMKFQIHKILIIFYGRS
jgi:hypothetical protein